MMKNRQFPDKALQANMKKAGSSRLPLYKNSYAGRTVLAMQPRDDGTAATCTANRLYMPASDQIVYLSEQVQRRCEIVPCLGASKSDKVA